MSLRVHFWGTRGSIPTPGPQTVRYGGNTPCTEVRTDDGCLIILDAGFMTEISDRSRHAFCRFFRAIAFGDGLVAARIVRETAARLPPSLDVAAFDSEIAELISSVTGKNAGQFQVAIFVGKLFKNNSCIKMFG